MGKKILDYQLQLLNGNIITFNDDQYVAIKKIREFLVGGETKIFTLSGYAGTGKTTCIKKILDEYGGNVVVSAPTHKAKKVIEHITNIKGETLHSLLGLRPDVDLDDFNPNSPDFHPIATPTIHNHDLIVIDESSMINEDLYFRILKEVVNGNVKVIYMGDPAQIPPIGEKESAVFNIERGVGNTFLLTKIERQNDSNPISFVHNTLRNGLNKSNGGYDYETRVNEKGEGIIFIDNKIKFRELIIEKYKSIYFKRSIDFVKVIAWRNDTVTSANKIIRNELFGEKNNLVEVGDVLMAYRSVKSTGRFNVIENSTDYKVLTKEPIKKNEYGLLGFPIVIGEELSNGQYKTKRIFIVDTTNDDNIHDYAEKHDTLKQIGRERKIANSWYQYYKFRRKSILMKKIDKHRNGTKRNKQDVINKDIDYGFAITAHKSQGSTYSHVFVLENDINQNRKIKERNQLKYTSFTRPTTSATVLID